MSRLRDWISGWRSAYPQPEGSFDGDGVVVSSGDPISWQEAEAIASAPTPCVYHSFGGSGESCQACGAPNPDRPGSQPGWKATYVG